MADLPVRLLVTLPSTLSDSLSTLRYAIVGGWNQPLQTNVLNSTGQVPQIPNLPGLIDGDTPEDVYTRTGLDGEKYELVFSDEVRTVDEGETKEEGKKSRINIALAVRSSTRTVVHSGLAMTRTGRRSTFTVRLLPCACPFLVVDLSSLDRLGYSRPSMVRPRLHHHSRRKPRHHPGANSVPQLELRQRHVAELEQVLVCCSPLSRSSYVD
jgi:hypothetical protein